MPEHSSKITGARTTGGTVAAALVAAVLLAGCAQTKSWIDRVSPGDDERGDDNVIVGAPNADDYLLELERLVTGDPATQIEIFADAESRSTLMEMPGNGHRYLNGFRKWATSRPKRCSAYSIWDWDWL